MQGSFINLIHPLPLQERILVLSPKKAPGLRKESVGPETYERAPSAKNFKNKLWRPLAALVIGATAVVYNEDHSSINNNHISDEGQPAASLFQESFKALPSVEEFEQKTVFLDELQDNPQSVFEFQLPKDLEESSNSSSENLNTPEPETEYITIASLDVKQVAETELSRITGYYCKQISGYFIGDGGGFCGNTASGKPVGPGVAACGNKWALGTKLHIENYGTVECQDRGHLAGNQVDIWFPTNKDMAESGKPEWAQVTVVKE